MEPFSCRIVRNSDTILLLPNILYQSENQKERILSTLLRFLAATAEQQRSEHPVPKTSQDMLTYQKMYALLDKFDEQYRNCSLYINERLPHLE